MKESSPVPENEAIIHNLRKLPVGSGCSEPIAEDTSMTRQVHDCGAAWIPMLAIVLLAAGVVRAQPAVWDEPIDRIFRAEFDDSEQRYVLLKPTPFPETTPRRLFIALHGHGSDRWQFVRDGRGECRGARDAALKHGFLFVAPDYRAKTSWMGPAATADVVQLLRDLRKEYRIDQVVIAGGSMGATSAVAFTAMYPELIDGVISLNGTANLVEYGQFSDAITASFGGTKAEKPDVYRLRSGELFPDHFRMPTAFTTGGQDKLVPPDSTLRLVHALQERKSPVLSIHRPDGGHDTNYDDSLAAFEFVIERVLRGPELPPPLIDLAAKPVKIVCLGDSVTGVYYHTGGRRAYPELLEIALKKAIPVAQVTVINAGISGHSTDHGLNRLERDVLQHQPDLVTISFGLNDATRLSPDQYRANLEQLIERCRARNAAVVLCTPNAVIDTAARPITKLNEFCAIIREVAQKHQVRVCDQFLAGNRFRERDPWNWRLTLSDEIHPNGDGHRRMAEELCRTIAGRHVSLDDLGPPTPALPRLRKLLADKQPIRVLAMPPLDTHIVTALQSVSPDAKVEITPWPIAGQTLAQIEQTANKTVRAFKPDLVLLTIPRDAPATNDEQFIHAASWIMNWSLSFGQQEWDVIAVHPAVFDARTTSPRDGLIRQLMRAQDVNVIDRPEQDQRPASMVVTDWLQQQLQNAEK